MTDDSVKRYDCLWYSEDLLLFHFIDSGIENGTVVSEGITEHGIACVDVEEGTVRVEEESYGNNNALGIR